MKKKKGFTLIELLAVIIILAIIALIATPIIMRVIENSKKGAAERGAENYAREVETEVVALRANGTTLDGTYEIKENGNLCQNHGTDCGEDEEIKIDMSGKKPSGGSIVISDGKISYVSSNIILDGYTLVFDNNKSAKTMIMMKCSLESGSALQVGSKYKCNPGDGDKFFYILEVSNNNVYLILDRNLDGNVAWCGDETLCKTNGAWDNTKGPLTALAHMYNKTSGWTYVMQSQLSLPTYDQIKKIIGARSFAERDLKFLGNNMEPEDKIFTGDFHTETGSYAGTRFYLISKSYEGNNGYFTISTIDQARHGVRPVVKVNKNQLSA